MSRWCRKAGVDPDVAHRPVGRNRRGDARHAQWGGDDITLAVAGLRQRFAQPGR